MFKRLILISAAFITTAGLSKAQNVNTDSVYSINEVTVNAYRSPSDLGKIPQRITIIDKSEIESVTSGKLDDVLKSNDAVDLVQYQGFNTGIGIRGYAPSGYGNPYTLIMVDGIPVGTENISTLDIENAYQVEILKGPYSAFFGSNAMAGVINIATKRSNGALSGKASISGGSFGTYKVKFNTGGKISNRFNFDLNIKNNAQINNYKTGNNNLLPLSDYEKQILDANSYGKIFNQSKYNVYTAGLRLGYDFNKNWKLDLNQNLWYAGNVQTNGNFWGTETDYQKAITRWSQNINLEGTSGIHNIKLSPYYTFENTDYLNDVSDSNFLTSQYVYSTYGTIFQDAINISDYKIIFGLDNHSKTYHSKQWYAKDMRGAPYQPDYSNVTTGILAQLNGSFLENKLNVTIGGRLDFIYFNLYKTDSIESENADEQYTTFNPNAGIKYEIINGLYAHSSTGTAFAAPDAFKVAGKYRTSWSLYYGNNELKPESSFSYDGGISYLNTKLGIQADVTYFENHHNNLIVYDYSRIDTISFMNSKTAFMNGLEMSFSVDLGALYNYAYSLVLYTNFTHMLNTDITVDKLTENLKYVRKDKGNFGVSFSIPEKVSARINARYVGSRYEDNWLYSYDYVTYEKIPYTTANGTPIRPNLINDEILKFNDFIVIDFSAGYYILKNLEIGLTINNLLNENYTEKDNFQMPGRSFIGSVSFRF